jgi:hypothetical protein
MDAFRIFRKQAVAKRDAAIADHERDVDRLEHGPASRSDVQAIANDCNPSRTIAVGALHQPVVG